MIKGQSKFKINDNLTIGQDENGMHYAVIRDVEFIKVIRYYVYKGGM